MTALDNMDFIDYFFIVVYLFIALENRKIKRDNKILEQELKKRQGVIKKASEILEECSMIVAAFDEIEGKEYKLHGINTFITFNN